MLKLRKTENSLHGVRNQYLRTNIFRTMLWKDFFYGVFEDGWGRGMISTN